MTMEARGTVLCIFAIFLFFAFLNFQACTGSSESGSGSDSDEDDCFECSTKINTSIDLMRDMLASREPMKCDQDLGPCTSCSFQGMKTLQPNRKVCPMEHEPDGDCYYDHLIELLFTKIVITCECTLEGNPLHASNNIISRLGEVMEEIKKQAQGEETGMPKKEIEMPSLTELQSKHCPVVNSDGMFSGNMTATWPNVKLSLTLRAWKESNSIKTVGVDIGTDGGDLIPSCSSTDTGFEAPCKCLLGMNFHFVGFMAIMKGMFGKGNEGASQKENEEMLHMLTCLDAM